MNNLEFKELEKVENIQEVVKNLFDVNLDISGGWGYDQKSAVMIHSLDMPLEQFMNLFTTLRANIEMNLTLNEDERCGGVTLRLEDQKSMTIESRHYEVASFKVTAMNEKMYAKFIKEYKENYGKKAFDIADHFKRRKNETIERVVECWFYEEKQIENRGKILKLFESHSNKSERVECLELKLDEDGVVNDKFYAKDRERSVLISSIESYTLATGHGIEMKYGDLGENIVVDFNPYAFPEKFQIQIGEVVLEITQLCTLCKSLTKLDSKLPKLLKNDRGVFAKVIKAGTISVDSEIRYEKTE